MAQRSKPSRWLADNAANLFFGVALAALAALGGWWALFISRAIARQYDFQLLSLRQSQTQLTLTYDSTPPPPPAGRSTLDERFLVKRCQPPAPPEKESWTVGLSRWPGLCVAADPQVLASLERKHRRQKLMLFGEGTLLFLLLGVAIVMLWRLVRSERRFLKELEMFVEVLTHRLKGPTTGLKVLLETIRTGGLKGDELADMIELGMVELDRQQQIVNNILVTCRDREEPWNLQPAPLSLKPFIESVAGRWKKLAGHGTLSIETRARTEDRVLADESALRIVLENVIDNAVKYSKPGDAHVAIDTDAGLEGMVELRVTDRGIGIKRQNLDKLFAPFWRGEGRAGGSGLGLYISQRIMRQIGGDLMVESKGEGKGVTVTLALPAARR